jgi:pilus assembly protein CpaF
LFSLLEDPEVTDVLVNGAQAVWVDGPGGLRQVAIRLGDPAAVRAAACQLAALGGQRLDDACPAVDVRLPGGTRMHAVLPPIARGGPLISLRALRRQAFGLHDLVARGTIPETWAALIKAMVSSRINFLISGATGVGKTTLLSALLGLVAPDQRIICIEEAAEIATNHPHCLSLEARLANSEGRGEVTLTDLVRQALRMRPDRIVLGECRGAEVREVLTALNTGHEGSAATIHANTASDVPARLIALGALAGMSPSAVAAQAQAGLAAVLHLARQAGSRRLVEVAVFDRQDSQLTVSTALRWESEALRCGPAYAALANRCGW